MYKLILFPIIIIIFCSFSCSHIIGEELLWEGDRGRMVKKWFLGDYGIYFENSNSDLFLLSVAYSDSNERLESFAVSSDETKIAFLVTNSTRDDRPLGIYFTVFDLENHEGNTINPDIEITDIEIAEYILNNNSLTYYSSENEEFQIQF